MTQPTVGRHVHYYGCDTAWHRLIDHAPHSDEERAWAAGFRGPFAATIARVFDGGEGVVALVILYPSLVSASVTEDHSEIVERVLYSEEPLIDGDSDDGCWTWPPQAP